MLNYFLKRLLGLIPTLLIVAVLVFLFVHLLPGDPARLAAGPEADEAVVQLVRKDLGAGSAAAAAVRTLLRQRAAGRLRHLDGVQAPGERRDRLALYADLLADRHQHAVGGGVRPGDRRGVGGVAQPLAGSPRHDAGGVGDLVPGLCARYAADAGVLGRTGVATDGGRRQLATLHSAFDHPGGGGGSGDGAFHPRFVRRGAAGRLHAHRAPRACGKAWW